MLLGVCMLVSPAPLLSLGFAFSLLAVRAPPFRLYPEEKAAMKDPAEALLEPDDWKKTDMFFEYRIKEGEQVVLTSSAVYDANRRATAHSRHARQFTSITSFTGITSFI